MRLDLADGLFAAGAVRIEPSIDLDRPVDPQMTTVRRIKALVRGETARPVDRRFARLVEALRVADALAAGASLRDIGLGVLGGDWPGDGEHLKSWSRRRVVLAADLIRAGPRGVLTWQI